ncbi:MAG: sensor histidine kinase [Anaerolineae bacterium]
MDDTHSPALLNTFRVALALKLAAVLLGLTVGYVLVGQWLLRRWGLMLANLGILAFLLLPWDQWLVGRSSRGAIAAKRWYLPLALGLAVIFPQVEQVYAAGQELAEWQAALAAARGLPLTQLNLVQHEAAMFTLVPVVLASWQYGRRGLRSSVALAAVVYLLAAPFLVPGNIAWPIYALSGLLRIGLLLIIGYTVQSLATAQRREQQALETANLRLAEQAVTMEQLATMRERNRLARELHDTLAHTLSGTSVQLQAVGLLLKSDVEAAAAELSAARQQVRAGLEEARRAIRALRAGPLEKQELAEALRQRLTSLGERAGWTVHCDLHPMPHLPPLIEQAAFRVADEALVNAEKHARAATVRLSLTADSSGIALVVHDDGAGFETSRAGEQGGFGLLGMKERAALAGGQVMVESAPGQGTTVRLYIPIPTTEL